MMTIFLTPDASLEDGIIRQKTTDKDVIRFFGREGKDWHKSLGDAKLYVEKCRKEEIKYFKEQIFKLKRMSFKVVDWNIYRK